jgi:hypothetical protein
MMPQLVLRSRRILMRLRLGVTILMRLWLRWLRLWWLQLWLQLLAYYIA